MKSIKISFAVIFSLLISVSLFAQHGRGHGNHYKPNYNYGYNHYSVRVVPRYNYRPYYTPAPIYRYRSVVSPLVYRSPRVYMHFGPAFGFRLNILPFGYSRLYVGPVPYYYYNGIYYRSYDNGEYEVVAPPLDAVVQKLPAQATITVIDGKKYYQVGGTFYQEEITEENKLVYRVVGTDGVINTEPANDEDNLNANDEAVPTIGSRYDELPADSKVEVINKQKYFVSGGGVYYKEVIEGDKVRYEVTSPQ